MCLQNRCNITLDESVRAPRKDCTHHILLYANISRKGIDEINNKTTTLYLEILQSYGMFSKTGHTVADLHSNDF